MPTQYYTTFTGLSKKYGDVITYDMNMRHKMVMLNSADAIYEGFVKNADSLSSRPPLEAKQTFTQGMPLCRCKSK